ncbi:MAG: hypothetical protein M5U15_04820 [Kiritimatiellae bacterium]|nr:hypothetical protein [Kiritimatiellia bacterium]
MLNTTSVIMITVARLHRGFAVRSLAAHAAIGEPSFASWNAL